MGRQTGGKAKASGRHEEVDREYSLERELVHEALEKIVKEELRKVAADAMTAAKEGKRGEKESKRVSSDDDYRQDLLKESRELALQNGTTTSTTANGGGSRAANKENEDDAESEREYNSRKFVKMIGEFAASAALAHTQKANGKKKKQGRANGKSKEGDDAVTELHIIEDGWEPYERSRFAGNSNHFTPTNHTESVRLNQTTIRPALFIPLHWHRDKSSRLRTRWDHNKQVVVYLLLHLIFALTEVDHLEDGTHCWSILPRGIPLSLHSSPCGTDLYGSQW